MSPLAVLLTSYAQKWRERPFDWGEANCGVFVSEWVELIEGCSPLSSLRTFGTERDVRRAIAEYGSLEAMVTFAGGRSSVSPNMARLGDIILLPNEDAAMDMLGICNGRTVLVLSIVEGVGFVEMSTAKCAWRLES